MRASEGFDVVIVGGGLVGCAAGILMLRGGLSVAMVDGFPWEWWHREPGGPGTFQNFSGGVLYGVPGHQPMTRLLIELGIPLNNPTREHPVSFKAMEPGFQVLMPRAWVNLFPEEDVKRELARVLPGEEARVAALYREAQKQMEKADGHWSAGLSGRRRESGAALSTFLDGWAAYWQAVFGGGSPTAQRITGPPAPGACLGTYLRLFAFGLCRRPPEEATAREVYDFLEFTSRPATLFNETGQRGVFACLRAAFHRAGGAIHRAAGPPRLLAERGGAVTLAMGEQQAMNARWVVLDAPEDELAGLIDQALPERPREAARPALHVSFTVPWASVPAGMGGHLVVDLEGSGEPMILTLAPMDGERALLEALLPAGRDEGEEVRKVLARVRGLLRFLPEPGPEPSVRRGAFPSHYGRPGFLSRVANLSRGLAGPSLHREGRFVITGRGDYLGTGLNGALGDGLELASWIMGKGGR